MSTPLRSAEEKKILTTDEMLKKHDVEIDRWPDTKLLIERAMEEYAAQFKPAPVEGSPEEMQYWLDQCRARIAELEGIIKAKPAVTEGEESEFYKALVEVSPYGSIGRFPKQLHDKIKRLISKSQSNEGAINQPKQQEETDTCADITIKAIGKKNKNGNRVIKH